MNVKVALVFALLCACHKREDAATLATTATTAQPAPPPVDSNAVASPAPTDTVAPIDSATAAPAESLEREEARRQAMKQAEEFGVLGALSSDAGVPWGRDDSLGRDPLSAGGNMWGNSIGPDAGMVGGLGLRGSGAGGGDSIGLGNIGTLGHGAGGSGAGYGSGSGRLRGRHPAPSVRTGVTTVTGRLPPEVIQRIVRQNTGRFRFCYEKGLRADPKLAGTLAVKFVIDPQGAVSSATREPRSTMTDPGVVSCITRAFSSLMFPQPEGGSVTVVYPLTFAPGD